MPLGVGGRYRERSRERKKRCVQSTHSRPHDIHGDGEDDGGASLSSNGVQGLQVAKLESSGRGNCISGFLQSTGSIELSFGRDNLEAGKILKYFPGVCR